MFPQTFSPALPVSLWETDPRCEVIDPHAVCGVCPVVAHVRGHSFLSVWLYHEVPMVGGWTFQPFSIILPRTFVYMCSGGLFLRVCMTFLSFFIFDFLITV